MKRASYIGLFAGLALFTGLIVWQGIGEVFGVLAASGWVLLPLGAVGAQAYWIADLFKKVRGWHT